MGMRMVADFFEMDGWDTYFIGANTPSRSIISAIEERQAHLVAISTTIPTHVSKVTELVGTIRENAGTSDCKVLVGGYPFNLSADLWKTVGADGYAPNALEAVQIADKLIGK
jgi:methanogenic corrinoid protein MtbC1